MRPDTCDCCEADLPDSRSPPTITAKWLDSDVTYSVCFDCFQAFNTGFMPPDAGWGP